MRTTSSTLIAAVLALAGCKAGSDQAPAQAVAPAVAAPVAAAAPAAAPAPAAGAVHEGCGDLGAPATDEPPRTSKDPATGATVSAVGANLTGAEKVTVAELLANPDKYSGKTVRLEGNVSAMCTHKRAWFAVQADDKSGSYVRVTAAPAFLVPEGSIGKKVRTEGTVEVTVLRTEFAQHLEQEHKLGAEAGKPAEAKTVTATQKAVVVKAAGAEFM